MTGGSMRWGGREHLALPGGFAAVRATGRSIASTRSVESDRTAPLVAPGDTDTASFTPAGEDAA